MISGFQVVNIFGLKENLHTACQNSCSMYHTGRVVKVLEKLSMTEFNLGKVQDTGYSFVKNWTSLQVMTYGIF